MLTELCFNKWPSRGFSLEWLIQCTFPSTFWTVCLEVTLVPLKIYLPKHSLGWALKVQNNPWQQICFLHLWRLHARRRYLVYYFSEPLARWNGWICFKFIQFGFGQRFGRIRVAYKKKQGTLKINLLVWISMTFLRKLVWFIITKIPQWQRKQIYIVTFKF